MDLFRSLSSHFRREFPHLNLSIRRKKWKGDYADNWPVKEFTSRGNVWWMVIWIQRDLSLEAQLFVLVHEVGHALTYWDDDHESDHGPVFGEGYAAAWRSYQRWAGVKVKKVRRVFKMRSKARPLTPNPSPLVTGERGNKCKAK